MAEMTVYDLTDGQDPMTRAEIDALRELARDLPASATIGHSPPIVVNIGAADGISTIAFLEGCPTATIYSVDVEPCEREFENAARCGVDAGRIRRVLGRSEAIGRTFPYLVDLLFVDGGHFNAGNDLDTWGDKVKAGGVIALHDFIAPPCPPNNPGTVHDDVVARFDLSTALWQIDRLVAFRV
jgi:predicted O-methyltransferase YrrM